MPDLVKIMMGDSCVCGFIMRGVVMAVYTNHLKLLGFSGKTKIIGIEIFFITIEVQTVNNDAYIQMWSTYIDSNYPWPLVKAEHIKFSAGVSDKGRPGLVTMALVHGLRWEHHEALMTN